MNFEDIMLNEISQTQKGKHLTSTYIRYPGSEILSVMSDSVRPNGLNSPGQNTGVGNLSLLREAS